MTAGMALRAMALGAGLFTAMAALAAPEAEAATLVDTVLQKYGLKAFDKVESIRFTFQGKALGFIGTSHTWIWKPKSDSVTLVDKGISYSRKNVGKEHRGIDKSFVNDQYWLMFPFHMAWDKGVAIAVDTGLTESPRNKERLRKIRVTYMEPGGYSPNDSYDLFVAPDGLIKEWTYHKRGGRLGMSWSWEDHAEISGLLFSRDHPGLFRIRFSDIQVDTGGPSQ
jgi:hypothetical protein